MQSNYRVKNIQKKPINNNDYTEGDFPPDDSYSDVFGLLHGIYNVFHQIVLTIFVLMANLVSKWRRKP